MQSKSTPSGSMKSRSRTTLNPTIDSRLAAYMALASAAGVAALAATPAEAKVLYTPANIGIGGALAIDLNHDGIDDFTFQTYIASHNRVLGVALDVKGNAIIAAAGGFGAAALPIASPIAPGKAFTTASRGGGFGEVLMESSIHYGSASGTYGPWLGAQNKFLGLKFLINGEVHFGWARVTVNSIHGAVLTGYAYESVANKPLRAGETKSSDEIADLVSGTAIEATTLGSRKGLTLGILAKGAPGLAWARKREQL
jgi:hypothetical protein